MISHFEILCRMTVLYERFIMVLVQKTNWARPQRTRKRVLFVWSAIGHSDEGRWANIKSGARRGKRRSWVINKKETMSSKWERRCHKPNRKQSVEITQDLHYLPFLWWPFRSLQSFFFNCLDRCLLSFAPWMETQKFRKKIQSFHLRKKEHQMQQYKIYSI